jgi:hypothetical protein
MKEQKKKLTAEEIKKLKEAKKKMIDDKELIKK